MGTLMRYLGGTESKLVHGLASRFPGEFGGVLAWKVVYDLDAGFKTLVLTIGFHIGYKRLFP
jgi:hypothetical protein